VTNKKKKKYWLYIQQKPPHCYHSLKALKKPHFRKRI